MIDRADERGVAGLLMLAVGVVAIVLALLVADVSVFVAARARAQIAADAAVLAAAPITFHPYGAESSPTAEAALYAAANGATLEECRCPLDSSWRMRAVAVKVMVEVDLMLLPATSVRAWSRAEFEPTRTRR